MVDFINEVEEELRKDDYNRLLKKYGPYIAGVIVLIIAGTAFIEWRDSADDRLARRAAASYLAADKIAREGNSTQAIADYLVLADVAPEGYAGLSYMRAAALNLDEGNRAEAVRLFDQAATTFSMPRHAQLAQLKAAYVLAGDGDYDAVMTRANILATKDAPYEFLARELLGYAALQTGDVTTARTEFSYLENIPGVPPTISERAKQSLALMQAADMPTDTPNTTPDAGGDTDDE